MREEDKVGPTCFDCINEEGSKKCAKVRASSECCHHWQPDQDILKRQLREQEERGRNEQR